MNKETDQEWQKLSEQILTDIKEWRRSHPQATLREIEDEVHARMNRLEAQAIQDAAQESSSRAWGGASPEERPHRHELKYVAHLIPSVQAQWGD